MGAPLLKSLTSHSFRILLVENNAENADLARQRLSEVADYSIEVLQVTRLSDAITTLDKMTVDAAIVGLDLPDSSGIDTLRRLRDLRPDIAVVVIAGDATEDLCNMALREGALDFLNKSELGSRLVTRTIVHALERLKAQKRQSQIEALLSVNPEAVVVIDQDGMVKLANDAALKLFGKDHAELLDKDFGLPVMVGKVSEVQFLCCGVSHTAVMRVVDCEWEGKPAFLASIRDTTEERQLAEQLRKAQKMEAIGLLAGGIAHDFNNLLLVMVIYAEIVFNGLDPGDRRRADVQEILDAVERAQALTEQLLAFARHQPIEPRIVDLNEVVNGVHNLLRRTLPANIDIQAVNQQGLWPVTVDPRRAEQVLMNLAVNARDAMPSGGKFTVVVENTALAEPTAQLPVGDYVSIRVSDDGAGILPEDISRIFDPFYTTKDVGKGTGLGLATCYGIIRQSNGDITVQSEAGIGTTFTIMLPRTRETVAVVMKSTVLTGPRVRGTETIVVVEDEPAVLRSTSRILRDAGYTVVEAVNGVDAREVIARQTKVDLVLTDVIMPKMGGTQLAEHLVVDFPQLKILFMTGYANDPSLTASTERHVLFKPFQSLDLLGKIREVLSTAEVAVKPIEALSA
ncbi:MAG: Blue-light-activated protein [Xanthobacteraceae bacterium]|nr:Blue-light-activated protein [Xanthobacteraceae bacterium]